MVTFVVHARRTPETLARVVSLFHRRSVEIERLTADRADDPNVLCITITVEMDADQTPRIETNLYKLVDVTLVKSSERGSNVGVPHD
jgi:acetolactate synthase small subunit